VISGQGSPFSEITGFGPYSDTIFRGKKTGPFCTTLGTRQRSFIASARERAGCFAAVGGLPFGSSPRSGPDKSRLWCRHMMQLSWVAPWISAALGRQYRPPPAPFRNDAKHLRSFATDMQRVQQSGAQITAVPCIYTSWKNGDIHFLFEPLPRGLKTSRALISRGNGAKVGPISAQRYRMRRVFGIQLDINRIGRQRSA